MSLLNYQNDTYQIFIVSGPKVLSLKTKAATNSDLPPLNFSAEKKVKGSEPSEQKFNSHLNLKSFSNSHKDIHFVNQLASEINEKASVS